MRASSAPQLHNCIHPEEHLPAFQMLVLFFYSNKKLDHSIITPLYALKLNKSNCTFGDFTKETPKE